MQAHFGKNACGVAFLDISTGEFLTGEGTYDYVEKLMGNFQPKEVLYNREHKHDFEKYFGIRYCTFEAMIGCSQNRQPIRNSINISM